MTKNYFSYFNYSKGILIELQLSNGWRGIIEKAKFYTLDCVEKITF